MFKLILVLFATNISFAALPPAPQINCYYDNSGFTKLELKFQEPEKVEGKEISQLELDNRNFLLCPDMSHIDSELTRNYKVDVLQDTSYEPLAGECRLMAVRRARVVVPLRKATHSYIYALGFVTLSKTLIKVVSYSECDDR